MSLRGENKELRNRVRTALVEISRNQDYQVPVDVTCTQIQQQAGNPLIELEKISAIVMGLVGGEEKIVANDADNYVKVNAKGVKGKDKQFVFHLFRFEPRKKKRSHK